MSRFGRAVPVVLAVLALNAAGDAAPRPRPGPCPPGRYLVAGGVTLVPSPAAPAPDVVTIDGGVAVASGCPPAPLRQRVGRRRVTRVKAVLTDCAGAAGPARLAARIDRHCATLRGVFRVSADRLRTRFTATRSFCGDGLVDSVAGEACEVGTGCAGCLDCRCGVTTTTTSSTVTTTTCVAAPPVVPPLRIAPVNATATRFAPFATQAPDSDDWYVVEQRGRIRIVRDGMVLEPPFLDIEAAIGTSLGERGLLSVAFHPRYAVNGRFFTMATPGDAADGTYAPVNADAVVEWARDPTDADRAMPAKVRDVVVLPVSAANHNGGTIVFGPDGYLYVGTGDGGGSCESNKPGSAQDPGRLFGKILRLDVDGPPPFAAPGNPFADDPRVYHYGLRNPFRLNFNPITHDLFIGDVGQATQEEISVAPGNAPGRNFGWPAFEGSAAGTCGDDPLGGPSPHTPPIVAVDRRDGSTDPFADYESIVAGRVYRGTAVPELAGVYLFADFFGSALGAIRYCDGVASAPVAIPLASIAAPEPGLSSISSFVQGHDGELYLTYGSAGRLGRLERAP